MIKMGKYSIKENNKLYYDDRVYIGEVYKEIDGRYVYQPECNGGFFEDNTLIGIGTFIQKLNEPFDKEIEEYFRKEREKDKSELYKMFDNNKDKLF